MIEYCLDVLKKMMQKSMKELYDGPTCGHFGRETTKHDILRVGYFWPSLFKDAHGYSRKCKVFQMFVGKETKLVIPLQPITIKHLF